MGGEEPRSPYQFAGGHGYEREPYGGGLDLVYLEQRYYEQDSGRFLTRDPIRWAGGLNLYGYVGNDPVNAVDPRGLSSKIALPTQVAQAIAAKDYGYALWLLEHGAVVGLTRAGLGRLAAAAIANPQVMSEVFAAVADVPYQPSGYRLCGYTALRAFRRLTGSPRLSGSQASDLIKVYQVLPRPGDLIRATVNGKSVNWRYHYYIRIGDTIVESVTLSGSTMAIW